MDSHNHFNNNDNNNMFNFPFFTIDKTYVLVFAIILLMFLYYLYKRLKNYIKKRSKLKELAEKYERKRESRKELKYHYYWAIDRREPATARNIGYQIIDADKELKELYGQYQRLKKYGFGEGKKMK